jgi:ubiquinone biosynthesis protein
MMHWRRGVFILWTLWRFGLDELLLSSIPQTWARVLARLSRIGRKLDAPRAERIRLALESLGPIFV